MSKYRIYRNVPIPEPVKSRRNQTGAKNVYPWHLLGVGDCFVINATCQRVSSMIAWRHSNTPHKYVRRQIDGKQWVWRVA